MERNSAFEISPSAAAELSRRLANATDADALFYFIDEYHSVSDSKAIEADRAGVRGPRLEKIAREEALSIPSHWPLRLIVAVRERASLSEVDRLVIEGFTFSVVPALAQRMQGATLDFDGEDFCIVTAKARYASLIAFLKASMEPG